MNGIIESFKPLWKKYRVEFVLISAAFIITLLAGSIFLASQSKTVAKDPVPRLSKKLPPIQSKKTIFVDLSGAVEKSDVYEVSSGARLKDILILAGGLSQDADRDFFSKNFNLARILQDQEKIYIPTSEETESLPVSSFLPQVSSSNTLGASDKVNINSGTESDLDSLPGIGKVTAQKIIQGRPYYSIEELLNKKIVGKSLFEKIKDLIQI